jgi:cytochrome c2
MYSEEFKKALDGVIWTPATLDIWIADSQGWVPGSVMFYKQPGPEVRRKIITYLESAR